MFHESARAVSGGQSYRWWVLGSLAMGTFTVALSAGLLLPATPKIMPDLQASISDVAWLSIAYLISFSALQPILGKQADLHGRKLFLVGGLAIFTAGSVLASISWDVLSMAVFRFVQGIGAAAVFPAGMALVGEYFPDQERGRAMGLWGMARGAALVIGPFVGGSTLDLFGWRAIYNFSIAVGIISTLSALVVLRESRSKTGSNQDYAGSIGLIVCVGALLLAISKGSEWGWTSLPTAVALTAFAIATGALLLLEKRAKDPLISFDVLGNPLFLASSATVFLLFVGHRGVTFLLPFFLTDVQGYSGGQIGLLLLPYFLPMVLASPLGGWFADRFDLRVPVLLGVALSVVAAALLALLKADTPFWYVGIVSLVFGLGTAVAQPALGKAIIAAAPQAQLGAAAGMFQMVRSKGGPFGVALFAAVYAWRAAARGRESLADCLSGLGLEPSQLAEVQRLLQLVQQGGGAVTGQSGLLRGLGPRLQEAQECARSAGMAEGFGDALLLATGLSALGVFSALMIRRSRSERVLRTGFGVAALGWTKEAESLLERIPSPMRGRGKRAVEAYAREVGASEVTPEVVLQARETLRSGAGMGSEFGG